MRRFRAVRKRTKILEVVWLNAVIYPHNSMSITGAGGYNCKCITALSSEREPLKPLTKRAERTVNQLDEFQFSVTSIDDNEVRVQDGTGREVAFEFPLRNVSLHEYDKFIDQMRNTSAPPPPIDEMDVSIRKVYSGSNHTHQRGSPNDMSYTMTWEQHADQHDMTVKEIKEMYDFARRALYARFRDRLRRR